MRNTLFALAALAASCTQAHAQSAWDKTIVVCDTPAFARTLIERTGGRWVAPPGSYGNGCLLQAVEYQRGRTVERYDFGSCEFLIVEVTLTRRYDGLVPDGTRYSILCRIETPVS